MEQLRQSLESDRKAAEKAKEESAKRKADIAKLQAVIAKVGVDFTSDFCNVINKTLLVYCINTLKYINHIVVVVFVSSVSE